MVEGARSSRPDKVGPIYRTDLPCLELAHDLSDELHLAAASRDNRLGHTLPVSAREVRLEANAAEARLLLDAPQLSVRPAALSKDMWFVAGEDFGQAHRCDRIGRMLHSRCCQD